mmetsp:Transcript_38460/g.64663  ORF Transcript_38460/g.64663 Transcript_38460/m.64663 type:complete len:240 (-) Transcript_38460:3511-4230(-)
MVRTHRLGPVAKPGDVTGGFLSRLEGVIGAGEVRHQKLDSLVVDLVLGEADKGIQELGVGHHLHRELVGPFQHHLTLVLDPANLVDGKHAQQEHGIKDPLDDVWRLLQRLQPPDVLRRDGRQRLHRRIQRRLRLFEVALRVLLNSGYLRSLLGHALHDDVHLLLFFLRQGRTRRDLLQEAGGHFLGLGQILVLDGELALHLVDVRLSLEKLVEAGVDLLREELHLIPLAAVQLLVPSNE